MHFATKQASPVEKWAEHPSALWVLRISLFFADTTVRADGNRAKKDRFSGLANS
jgi:hypothetical protein